MYFPTHIHIETHQASASSASRANDTARSPCAPAQSPLQTNAPQRLDMALYEALLHELQGAPHPLAISLYWEDEPLANPSFFAYARLGRERLPTATWFLETSSAFLNEARIAELKALFSGVTINVHNEAEYDAFDEHEFSLVPARFPHRIQLPTALQRARGFADREDEAIFHVNEL